MNIHVIKFGGTSLHTDKLRNAAAGIIEKKLRNNIYPIIVVSAIGRIGNPYSTDEILNLLSDNPSKEISDFISNCGEMISAAVFSDLLTSKGIKASPLTGWQAGIITNSNFSKAGIVTVLTDRIKELHAQKVIPVVSGFQGVTSSGKLTTLGRGGSDLTAAVLAKYLKAEKLEIYKDVDGVFTADPNYVPSAKIISQLDMDELTEITGNGAVVVNRDAALLSRENNVPLCIGNTLTGKIGTLVKETIPRSPVTAVTSKPNLLMIRILFKEPSNLIKVFQLFSQADISLDFITFNDSALSFVIEIEKINEVQKILKYFNENKQIEEKYCKLTLIGTGMTGQPGVMNRVLTVLQKKNIEVFLITDSYSTISVLVKQEDEINALNILHNTFLSKEDR